MSRYLQHGVRRLLRSPGFTAAVLLTLSLGIGATTSTFTTFSSVLLHSLPFDEPARLVGVQGLRLSSGNTWPIGYLDYLALRQHTDSYSDLAVYTTSTRKLNLAVAGEIPESVAAELVSANYFRTLGVSAWLGRIFTEQEDTRGAPERVVVLSYHFWESFFGKDDDVLGRTISLNGVPHELVGVLPQGFRGATDAAEIWLPVTLAAEIYNDDFVENRFLRWLNGVARLRPDVSLARVQEELKALGTALKEEFPEENNDLSYQAVPLQEAWFGDLRTPLLTLVVCSALVLLIVCVNISSLLLSRALRQEREFAIQAALGAPRRHLVLQVLTENLILAGASLAFGLLIAHFGTKALLGFGAVRFRSFIDVGLDVRVIVVMAVVALFCAVGLSLTPLLYSLRIDLVTSLKQGGRGSAGSGRAGLRKALVIAEVALAVVLFIGAALVTQSFLALNRIELGFDPDRLFAMRMDLLGESYENDESKWQLARRISDRMGSVPGIDSLALAGPSGLLGEELYGFYFVIEDHFNPETDDRVLLPYHIVTPSYFETLGITLLEGRLFTEHDVEGTPPVMVVTRSLAERFWPDESALGKRIKMGGGRNDEGPWYTVEGVVADIAYEGRTKNPELDTPTFVFVPLMQEPPTYPPLMYLVARSSGDNPAQLIRPLQLAMKDVDPDLPLHDPGVLHDRLDEQTSRDRFLLFLMSLFAFMALALAGIGIYGIIAYSVEQHAKEIALRMALGADRSNVLKRFLGESMKTCLVGVAIGVFGAFVLGRFVESLLYEVKATDPLTLVSSTVILLAVAVVASLIPARTATRIEPVEHLHTE